MPPASRGQAHIWTRPLMRHLHHNAPSMQAACEAASARSLRWPCIIRTFRRVSVHVGGCLGCHDTRWRLHPYVHPVFEGQ